MHYFLKVWVERFNLLYLKLIVKLFIETFFENTHLGSWIKIYAHLCDTISHSQVESLNGIAC